MRIETKKKIKELIKMIKNSDSKRIEYIADLFPEEYENESEYVQFQMEIGMLVNERLQS